MQMETELDIEQWIEDASYPTVVQEMLQKVLPAEIFSSTPKISLTHFLENALPFVVYKEEQDQEISFYLLSKYHWSLGNFFSEMLTRWLLPFEDIESKAVFSSTFSWKRVEQQTFFLGMISFSLKDEKQKERFLQNWASLEKEIKHGTISPFHAKRILEFKGLTERGKTAKIQEKLKALMHKQPLYCEESMFAQMQRFMVNAQENFTAVRDYHHISRIISLFYVLRKKLEQAQSSTRQVEVKLLKTQLRDPEKKQKAVLGIIIAMNPIKEYELFEEGHAFYAMSQCVKNIRKIPHSFFIEKRVKDTKQFLYLEIEKISEEDFTRLEIQTIRDHLPGHVKEHVECLVRPVFMPRNQEEIFKNIMSLAKQLKYTHDLPQIFLSYDEQSTHSLLFTAVFLRVKRKGAKEFSSFVQKNAGYVHLEKRKKMGMIRGKCLKEAGVFRIEMPTKQFLRPDRSIDLLKARRQVLQYFVEGFGEIRDYNGGMIQKESQVLEVLKKTLGKVARQQELLVDRLFYSIFPLEKRSLMEVGVLKKIFQMFFDLYRHTYKKTSFLKKEGEKQLIIMTAPSLAQKKSLRGAIQKQEFSPHEITSIEFDNEGAHFLGYILQSHNKTKRAKFLKTVHRVLDV